MQTSKSHRCGKHAVNVNPESPAPVWTACPVCSSTAEVDGRFAVIAGRAFPQEESARLGRIVAHAMLD